MRADRPLAGRPCHAPWDERDRGPREARSLQRGHLTVRSHATLPGSDGHRLLLATTSAGGLRVSEVVALKVADLDADRMTIHISQGKGGQDRYVPLSQRLLQDWRAYWCIRPPHVWLFANRQGTRPIDITVAQKLYTMAKLRAGIAKQGGIHALRHAGICRRYRHCWATATSLPLRAICT